MRGIFVNGARLGTVASFAGNPRAERWVAWSIHRKSPVEENRACFPTRHAAIDWLREEAATAARASSPAPSGGQPPAGGGTAARTEP